MSTSVIGFDSAWTDRPNAPGAVCILRHADGSAPAFIAPRLASFTQTLELIEREKAVSARIFVAIDQPTIVPNPTGSRPADRVAASFVSWLGGGVQPASRAKLGMFCDNAPIWAFKSALGASDDPEAARAASQGVFLAEVFPALALPSLDEAFFGRRLGPRYNPARRATFQFAHWQAVLSCAAATASAFAVPAAAQWCLGQTTPPTKPDQDRLDALLCALIGWHWLFLPRDRSLMIGDLETGYIIIPATDDAKSRIVPAAAMRGVGAR